MKYLPGEYVGSRVHDHSGPNHIVTKTIDVDNNIVETKCGLIIKAELWTFDIALCHNCLHVEQTERNKR